MLGNPAFDSSMRPELGFIEDAIIVAKRGRRFTMETQLLDSTLAKKKTRGFERSARRYGDEGGEIRRLREHPDAMDRYRETVEALQRRN